MEPLSPQDPLHTLLGKARPVEPRPNFTQNVMRTVRQLPQRLTWRERVEDWLGGRLARPALIGACAALALAGFLAFHTGQSGPVSRTNDMAAARSPSQNPVAQAVDLAASEPDVTADLASMDQLSVLLAQRDTRAMTDTEVAFLLY